MSARRDDFSPIPFYISLSHLSPALTCQACVSSGYSSTQSSHLPSLSSQALNWTISPKLTLSRKAIFSQLAEPWHTQSIPSWLTGRHNFNGKGRIIAQTVLALPGWNTVILQSLALATLKNYWLKRKRKKKNKWIFHAQIHSRASQSRKKRK